MDCECGAPESKNGWKHNYGCIVRNCPHCGSDSGDKKARSFVLSLVKQNMIYEGRADGLWTLNTQLGVQAALVLGLPTQGNKYIKMEDVQ